MRDFTKKFIEENIEIIENKEYAKICRSWYDAADADPIEYDDALFDEFTTILKHVLGIDFISEAATYRYGEIYFQVQYIITYFTSKTAEEKVLKNQVLHDITTGLGFTESELLQICDKVATDMGLKIETEYYSGVRS